MSWLKKIIEDRKFKKKYNTFQKQIAPYIKGYEDRMYILNIDKVVADWENHWEIKHFSFKHISFNFIDTVFSKNDSINIHPSSAKEVIKRLGLKKYGLFSQEGARYRLEEWKPKGKQKMVVH